MATDDSQQIQIRCPKCTQRFRVGQELKGRMVECGACEFRFRVDEDSNVKSRKFYPGEKRKHGLNLYSRQPQIEFAANLPVEVAHYAEVPDIERFEPTPMSKVIVGLVGAGVMAITLLILVTGASQHGVLNGVTTDRRMVIAAFFAVVGTVMISYANPRARGKATFLALIAAAGLILTPIWLTEGSKPLIGTNSVIPAISSPVSMGDGRKKIADLKAEVLYAPMEKALLEAGTQGHVIGVWMKGIRDSNAALVNSYLMRASGASEQSHLYPRMNQNYLLVLTRSQLSLEEMAKQCERVGQVDSVIPELHLIQVTVDNEQFNELPIAKLSDQEDGSFYQMNYRELLCIDIRRINEALLRLSVAKPVQSRDDIIRRMIELLDLSDREMLSNLCKALTQWSNGTDGAPGAAMKAAIAIDAKHDEIPMEAAAFLIKWRQPEVYPILDKMWQREPTMWEEVYMKSGAPAQDFIIPHLIEGSNRHRMSAARIAGRLGGEKIEKTLRSVWENTTDLELKTSFENALAAMSRSKP
jgi:hypothetical protein